MRHVERMPNERVAKRIKMETIRNKTERKAKIRWEDNVRNDLRKVRVKNWKQRAQETKQWNEIIEQAKFHKEL